MVISIACWVGIAELVNNGQISIHGISEEIKKNWMPSLGALISSCFGTFHLMATEEIGKQIHSSIKTMYMGVVFMLVGPIAIIIWEPQYFKVWDWKDFTARKLAFECLLSAIFYIACESLSTAIENLDVSTSSVFLYLSVLGFNIGDKMIQSFQ